MFDRRAMLQSAALAVWTEVRAVLAGAEIPCLPVKGLVTARWLYESPEQREISDIDVRIRPRDLARARKAGLAAAWTLLTESRVYGQLLFNVGGMDVDVESSCGPPGFTALTVEAMIAHARVDVDGGRALLGPVPDDYDHAILLVVNAVKDHVVDAARWAIEDVRRVVRLPTFDAATFIERAAGARALGMLVILADHFGDSEPCWREIGARVRRRGSYGSVYTRLFGELLRRRRPEWAVRIAARLASDGVVRPASSLVRAAAYELELVVQREVRSRTRAGMHVHAHAHERGKGRRS